MLFSIIGHFFLGAVLPVRFPVTILFAASAIVVAETVYQIYAADFATGLVWGGVALASVQIGYLSGLVALAVVSRYRTPAMRSRTQLQ